MEFKLKAEEFEKGEKKMLKGFLEALEKQTKISNLGKKIINISKNDILDEAYDFFGISGGGKMTKLIKKILERDIKLAISTNDDDEFTGIIITAYEKNNEMLLTAETKDDDDDRYIVDIVSTEKKDEKVSRPEGFKKIIFKGFSNRWWDASVIIED